jgi:hypothetical protein
MVSLAPDLSAFAKLLGVNESTVNKVLASWGRIFSPRGLDALQNREAQEHNCTHCDPLRGNMQYHGSVDQPANQDQEADNIDSE